MLYFLARWLFVIYFHLFYRIKVTGGKNIPKKGSFILCSNHVSNADPMILANATGRKIHYMAKKSLFHNKFFGFVLRALGAFPVDRESVGMDTFRSSMEILKSGKAMGIFSQGTRMSAVDINSAKSGVALFASKSGCKVVPAGIKLTKGLQFFSVIHLNIGEPMDFSEMGKKLKKEQLEEITTSIMEKVAELSS